MLFKRDSRSNLYSSILERIVDDSAPNRERFGAVFRSGDDDRDEIVTNKSLVWTDHLVSRLRTHQLYKVSTRSRPLLATNP